MPLRFKRKNKQSEPNFEPKSLEPVVIEALKNIYDPEIPVNIYDLGLIYEINIDNQANILIKMTLTAPGCPVAQTFPGTVENEIKKIPQVNNATVELVWDPPWSQERMSERAKLELGLF